MNCNHIKDHNLVAHYVAGQVSADENEQLELHFLECAQCVEEIEFARSMRGALRSLSVEEIEEFRCNVSSELGELGEFAESTEFAGRTGGFRGRFTPSRQLLGVAAVSVLLLVLSATLFSLKIVRLQRELEAAKYSEPISPLNLPTRTDQTGTALNSGQTISSAEQKSNSTATVPSKSIRLANKKGQTENSVSIANRMDPQVNTPIFILKSVADVERGQVKLQNELLLRPDVRLFVISVDPPEGSVQPFQATIRDRQSRQIWHGAGLRVDDHNALVLSFPSNLISAGDYDLLLWQLNKQGEKVQVGDYPFRLSKIKK